jgi:hypothetical protein
MTLIGCLTSNTCGKRRMSAAWQQPKISSPTRTSIGSFVPQERSLGLIVPNDGPANAFSGEKQT